MKNKRYFAYFVDIKDDGGAIVKAGTPLEYVSHEYYDFPGAPSKDNIPEAMSIEFNRLSRVENQSYMVEQYFIGDHHSPQREVEKCIEISEELALRLAEELDKEYYEKVRFREERGKRIIKFILNLMLFPLNMIFKIDCGELISEEVY